MSHNFAEATAVQKSSALSEAGALVYDGMVHEGWDILGNTNGGYLMAMAARAMADAAGRPPLTMTAHFLSPGAVGPHVVEVNEVRSGRRFATMTGSVVNVETGREVIRVLGTFGHHDTDGVV
ncbi:MAG: acyl-CoA thioesterase domain-containing protein, partial [Ilumatobacteraceae bacterium]